MFKLKNNVFSLKRILNIKFNGNINNYSLEYVSRIQISKSLLNTTTPIKFNFCEKINKEEKEDLNKKRYEYDYEAPEDSNYEYKSIIKRFLNLMIRICLFSFGLYYFFFQKINLITKNRELYLLNEYFEIKVTNYLSKKIQNIFENYIYHHEHKDVEFVIKVYKILLKNNKIPFEKIDRFNIFIIQSESLGCFILKNGDLFISSRLIEVCKNNENYLAMFISNELAYQAMGKNSKRIFKIWLHKKKEKSNFLKKVLYKGDDLPSFSLLDKKQKQLEYFNRFLLFYPESIVLNYFEEKEVLRLALKLINNSEYDILEVK